MTPERSRHTGIAVDSILNILLRIRTLIFLAAKTRCISVALTSHFFAERAWRTRAREQNIIDHAFNSECIYIFASPRREAEPYPVDKSFGNLRQSVITRSSRVIMIASIRENLGGDKFGECGNQTSVIRVCTSLTETLTPVFPGEELLSELQRVLHPNAAALPEAGLRPAAHRLQ